MEAITESAGLSVLTEVQVQGKQRPVDLFISDWHVAIDLTVANGLDQSEAWDLIAPAEEKAERAKIQKYHTLCEAANLDFVPLGMNTFGSFAALPG